MEKREKRMSEVDVIDLKKYVYSNLRVNNFKTNNNELNANLIYKELNNFLVGKHFWGFAKRDSVKRFNKKKG